MLLRFRVLHINVGCNASEDLVAFHLIIEKKSQPQQSLKQTSCGLLKYIPGLLSRSNLPSNFIAFIFSSESWMRDSRKRRRCDDLHQLHFESVLVQLPRDWVRQEVAVSLLE